MHRAYRDMVDDYSERYRFAAYYEDHREEYSSNDSDYSFSESEHDKYVSLGITNFKRTKQMYFKTPIGGLFPSFAFYRPIEPPR